ncbi:copper chaperone CopZ [Bacillaceae bacterium S4-13-56]
MKATLNVQGMTCDHCKKAVNGALLELDGVESVEVDLASGKVEVEYDESKATIDQMNKAVEEQGYDVVA